MVSVTDFQQMTWVVYNNLKQDLINPDLSDGDIENSKELLSGFLRNQDFEQSLLVAAQENDSSALPALTRDVQTAYSSAKIGFASLGGPADFLINEMQAGNLEILGTLLKGYSPLTTNLEINNFGIDAFDDAVEAMDSDAYYHVVADPRYAEIQARFSEQTGIEFSGIEDDIAEAKEFIANNPDPAMQAQAQAFYTEYLVSPDAYMSTAPIITAQSAPLSPDAPNAPTAVSTNLPSKFSDAVSLQTPPISPVAPTVDTSPSAPLAPPAQDIMRWGDSEIMATMDQLQTLNPVSIETASPVTQEAFEFIAEIRNVELAEATYQNSISFGKFGSVSPVNENDLPNAQQAAYEYLEELDVDQIAVLSADIERIIATDQEQNFEPLTPQAEANAQSLKDIGLDVNAMPLPSVQDEAPIIEPVEDQPIQTAPYGAAMASTLPDENFQKISVSTTPSLMLTEDYSAAATASSANVNIAPAETLNVYTVQKIDGNAGLWGIAQRELGLTDHSDIMRFTDHVERLNAMPNRDLIQLNEPLVMPTLEQIQHDVDDYYANTTPEEIATIRQDALNANNPDLVDTSPRPVTRPTDGGSFAMHVAAGPM